MAHQHEETFFKNLMTEVHSLWRQEQLCDIRLKAQNQVVSAHRVVLAAVSPYFKAMFCSHLDESQQTEIEIQGLSSSVLHMIVEYAYTSVLLLTEENVQMVLHAASIMQISSLEHLCTKFLMEQLHPSNCLGIRDFAQCLGCFTLYSSADSYCQDNFLEVSQNDEFLHLSATQVVDLVARDKLKVSKEEEVYTAVIRWLEFDPEGRAEDMVKIMENVRLPLVQWEFLMGKVSKHKLFTNNEQCRHYFQEARAFQASIYHPDLLNFAFNESVLRAQPRVGFGTTEYLYAVGGETTNRDILCSVEGFNPITNKTKQLTPMPTTRRSLGVVVIEKMLYAIGGSDGTSAINAVEMYNTEKDIWMPRAGLCEPRASLSAAAVDDKIFALGGHNGLNALRSVEIYDVDTNSWSATTEMLSSRSMAAAVSIHSHIFILGGYDGNMDLSSAEVLDTRNFQWKPISSMHEARSMMDAAVLEEKIFVVGGSNESQCLASVEAYDPSTNQWTLVQSLNVPRRGVGVAFIGGSIYAAGGHDGNAYLNSIEKYSKYSKEWTTVGCMEDYRGRFGFA